MDASFVKNYFENMRVVSDYAKAVDSVGLWASEKMLIERYIPKTAKVLELGCGAGRIAIGMARLGYENIYASDFSTNMVDVAKQLAERDSLNVEFSVQDATAISLPDETFDVVIFGFNGLMQIPKHQNRFKAMCEIHRVLKEDGLLIFTTHDRALTADYWNAERKIWSSGGNSKLLDEFGDKCYEGEHGEIFIHSPDAAEVERLLKFSGFDIVFESVRSDIAEENSAVKDFSDECVFRVVKKTD